MDTSKKKDSSAKKLLERGGDVMPRRAAISGGKKASVYSESPYPLLFFWFVIPITVLIVSAVAMHIIDL